MDLLNEFTFIGGTKFIYPQTDSRPAYPFPFSRRAMMAHILFTSHGVLAAEAFDTFLIVQKECDQLQSV